VQVSYPYSSGSLPSQLPPHSLSPTQARLLSLSVAATSFHLHPYRTPLICEDLWPRPSNPSNHDEPHDWHNHHDHAPNTTLYITHPGSARNRATASSDIGGCTLQRICTLRPRSLVPCSCFFQAHPSPHSGCGTIPSPS
jgi:hypothetical protein